MSGDLYEFDQVTSSISLDEVLEIQNQPKTEYQKLMRQVSDNKLLSKDKLTSTVNNDIKESISSLDNKNEERY